jgi:hypothetical protein
MEKQAMEILSGPIVIKVSMNVYYVNFSIVGHDWFYELN